MLNTKLLIIICQVWAELDSRKHQKRYIVDSSKELAAMWQQIDQHLCTVFLK